MSLEEKQAMSTCIRYFSHVWQGLSPKTKQWVWFVVLWSVGLLTIAILTLPIKFLVYMMKKTV